MTQVPECRPNVGLELRIRRTWTATVFRSVELRRAREPLIVAARIDLVRARQPAREERDLIDLATEDLAVVDKSGLEMIVTCVRRSLCVEV